MDPELSTSEAESIIAQMQAGLTRQLNEQRALRYIDSVLVAYRTAKAELASGLEVHKNALKLEIIALEACHDTLVESNRKDADEYKAKSEAITKRLAELTAQVQAKEVSTQARLVELSNALTAKQASLDKVTAEYQRILANIRKLANG